MPRGPAPGWKQPAEHTREAQPYIAAAVKVGYEVPLTWHGIASKERAQQCRRGLFNAARLQGVSLSSDIEAAGGQWRIVFVIHNKKVGRAYIVAKHGKDRTQWPYNSRARSA